MMYTSSVLYVHLEYFVLWATQKRQNLINFEGEIFTRLDL
jgi:hypothetical protein